VGAGIGPGLKRKPGDGSGTASESGGSASGGSGGGAGPRAAARVGTAQAGAETAALEGSVSAALALERAKAQDVDPINLLTELAEATTLGRRSGPPA